MIPVHQTIFAGEDAEIPGNCYQAALASLFELPLEKVPHFMERDDWYVAVNEWLGKMGMALLLIQNKIGQDWWLGWHLPPLLIAAGPGPRGHRHAVIVDHHMELVHDPHPSGLGLLSIDELEFIVCLEPKALLKGAGGDRDCGGVS